MAEATVTIDSYIDWTGCELVERIPGKVSGRSVVRGTRILADTIVQDYELGESVEEIDKDLDHRLCKRIEAHEVFTVRYRGWSGLKNGELLATAEQNGIEVFVTADQNLSHQQNLSGRRMAIVVLSASSPTTPSRSPAKQTAIG